MKKRLRSTLLLLLMTVLPLTVGAAGLTGFAQLLDWQASEESTSFWANGSSLFSNPAVLNPPNINFGYSHGFRGGFSYEPERLWDLKLYWTYLPANKSMNVSTPDQVLVPEFFSGFLSGNFFFSSQLNWTLYMNMIDLEASHKFNITKSLVLSPMIGLKGGTINQNITSVWNADVFAANENVLHKYFGLGPSLGLSGKWNFIKDLNLVGNFSTAFMWGNWNIEDIYTRPLALGGLVQPITITTYQNHASLGTLTFDYFLGFEWAHKGKVDVSVQLGV